MQLQTQSQIFKICNSCKRTLQTGSFGITCKSKDGFNACCKECRNYRRRKAYHGSSAKEANILPLNENNRTLILETLAGAAKVEIPCLDTKSNTSLTFKIEKFEGAYRFELFNATPSDRDTFYTGYTKLFVDIAVKLLKERNIRLFSIDQPHAILEWQYNQANLFGKSNTN